MIFNKNGYYNFVDFYIFVGQMLEIAKQFDRLLKEKFGNRYEKLQDIFKDKEGKYCDRLNARISAFTQKSHTP